MLLGRHTSGLFPCLVFWNLSGWNWKGGCKSCSTDYPSNICICHRSVTFWDVRIAASAVIFNNSDFPGRASGWRVHLHGECKLMARWMLCTTASLPGCWEPWLQPSCHVAVQQILGMIGPRRLRPNVRISACPIHGDAAFLRTFAFLLCCCILGPYCDLPNSALWCPCESDVLWVPFFLRGRSWWLWIGDISPMQRQVFHLQVISSIEYQRGESWNYRIPQVIPMPLGVKTRVKLVKWEKVMADFFVT